MILVNQFFDMYIKTLTDSLVKFCEKRFDMFHNNIPFVLVVVYWLCSMGESGVFARTKSLQSHITDGHKRMFAIYFCIDMRFSYVL